ncbi:MAG: ABC transporter ATP-binding protein [Eubacterium sp.]|nr:ABC transporter ATP-binding protein [Eubacterium sp.]
MIKLQNVSFKYGSGKKEYSLKNISLNVSKGQCLIITGESGCGKTTLTRIMNGLCPVYYEGVLEGEYRLNEEVVFSSGLKSENIYDDTYKNTYDNQYDNTYNNDDLGSGEEENGKADSIGQSPREWYDFYDKTLDEIGGLVGNVFQDPRSQFFCLNTTDEIVLSMENHNFSRDRMKQRIDELDILMDIRRLMNCNLLKLSSGEKQKVAIASAVSVEPMVIILDEPSANLDGQGSVKLCKLLAKLKNKGYTIIISEHRISYLKNIADRMIVMDKGSIIKDFPRNEFVNISDQDMIGMGLRILSDNEDFIPTDRKMGDAPLIRLEKITFKRGKRTILKDFSDQFYRGQITAITGLNGVGKTTLCKIISGELKEKKGSISIFGEPVPAGKRMRDCFFVGQDSDYQIFTPRVIEEVSLNTEYGLASPTIKKILEDFDLWEYRDRHPASLSGGQKQRVVLAAALLSNKPILILDEPTSGLDGRHMRIIAKTLKRAAEGGICILLISHDMEFINLAADKVLEIKGME